jgi:hypothetical protein
LAAVSLALWLGGPWPFAGARTPPQLEFDVPFSISCRALPLKDPRYGHSGKDLVEVVVPISARVRAGTERDLKQCRYTLVDPTEPGAITVTDWLPRTELRSQFAKPIQVSNERLAKVGITLSAHYVITAAGEAAGQLKSAVAYEMLPPREIVVASGTVQHGHGVSFLMKPSSQTTLEGMKSFSAILAVPHGWRGGCVKLECEAVGLDRGIVSKLDREVSGGLAVFYLALSLAGDEEGEALADRVANCQQALLDSLGQHWHEVGAAPHKLLPWPGWLGMRPRFFEHLDLPDETRPVPAEVALLSPPLDRAPAPAGQREALPPPVREKLRARQEAGEALQALSAPLPSARARPAAGQAPLAPPLPSTGADLATGRAAAGHGDAPKMTNPAAGASARPSLSPKVGGGVKPLELADDGGVARTGPAGPLEQPLGPGQQSKDVPAQAWYLLASIWGALFTYIVAPLVVDFIRSRMKAGRRHRSRRKPAPPSGPATGSQYVTSAAPCSGAPESSYPASPRGFGVY